MEAARPAVADDLPDIEALARAAIDELTASKGGDVWRRREARQEPVGAGLAHAIEASDHHVVVGQIDEATVGYGVAHTETLGGGEVLGVVDDLYVDPEARAVGVGEAIMNELVAWCEARSCFGIDALALPGSRATKNFFERFGLVARAIVVHRRLDRP